MGQFNADLIRDLALTADPKGNNTMDQTGDTKGFSPEAIVRIEQFKNAVFKLILMRAYNYYLATDQGSKLEPEREAIASFSIHLDSLTVHPDADQQDLKSKGIITRVSTEEYDKIPGGSDDPCSLLEKFNNYDGDLVFALACK